MELVPTNCNIWQKLLKTSAPAEMLVAELLDSDLNAVITAWRPRRYQYFIWPEHTFAADEVFLNINRSDLGRETASPARPNPNLDSQGLRNHVQN